MLPPMRIRFVQGVVSSVADRALILAVATCAGAAAGPLYSRFTPTELGPGDAAAWGLTWGFAYGIFLILIMHNGAVR